MPSINIPYCHIKKTGQYKLSGAWEYNVKKECDIFFFAFDKLKTEAKNFEIILMEVRVRGWNPILPFNMTFNQLSKRLYSKTQL